PLVADDDVIARVAAQHVIQPAAEEDVVAGPAVDGVAAGPAVGVGRDLAGGADGAVVAQEDVVAALAEQPVVAVEPIVGEDRTAADQVVVPGAAVQFVGAGVALQVVGALDPRGVDDDAAGGLVDGAVAEQQVVAPLPVQLVLAGPADQRVVAEA